METIVEQLNRNFEKYPDKTAIIHENRRISYRTTYETANKLAWTLIEKGVSKGDRVALIMQKSPEHVISFLAVTIAGGIVVPVDPTQPKHTVQYLLDLVQPKALVLDATYKDLILSCELPCPSANIVLDGEEPSPAFTTWKDVCDLPLTDYPQIKINKEDVVYLNFTSGSTGLPKGAVTTHAHIYWNTRSAVDSLALRHDDVHICMFPVFMHPHELFARALFLGGTIVLVDSVRPKTITKMINEHGVTCMMAIASIWEMILRQRDGCSHGLQSLRLAESGGMFTSPGLVHDFQQCFGLPITPVWGSTETTGVALVAGNGAGYFPGSMGKPCPTYQVGIIGEDGQPLPVGEMGEMVIRGPAVCEQYFNNRLETHKQICDGWFFTGDIVLRDDDNNFFFVDRKERMMKVAGMKVFPSEIEKVLSRHPMVEEVAVTKDHHHTHGEIPKAHIVLKAGADANKADFRKFCEDNLARYKVPRIIEFREVLPKTSGGKVLWRELQMMDKTNNHRMAG
jgi:long-chain acyl-CoA synthetase